MCVKFNTFSVMFPLFLLLREDTPVSGMSITGKVYYIVIYLNNIYVHVVADINNTGLV